MARTTAIELLRTEMGADAAFGEAGDAVVGQL